MADKKPEQKPKDKAPVLEEGYGPAIDLEEDEQYQHLDHQKVKEDEYENLQSEDESPYENTDQDENSPNSQEVEEGGYEVLTEAPDQHTYEGDEWVQEGAQEMEDEVYQELSPQSGNQADKDEHIYADNDPLDVGQSREKLAGVPDYSGYSEEPVNKKELKKQAKLAKQEAKKAKRQAKKEEQQADKERRKAERQAKKEAKKAEKAQKAEAAFDKAVVDELTNPNLGLRRRSKKLMKRVQALREDPEQQAAFLEEQNVVLMTEDPVDKVEIEKEAEAVESFEEDFQMVNWAEEDLGDFSHTSNQPMGFLTSLGMLWQQASDFASGVSNVINRQLMNQFSWLLPDPNNPNPQDVKDLAKRVVVSDRGFSISCETRELTQKALEGLAKEYESLDCHLEGHVMDGGKSVPLKGQVLKEFLQSVVIGVMDGAGGLPDYQQDNEGYLDIEPSPVTLSLSQEGGAVTTLSYQQVLELDLLVHDNTHDPKLAEMNTVFDNNGGLDDIMKVLLSPALTQENTGVSVSAVDALQKVESASGHDSDAKGPEGDLDQDNHSSLEI